MKKLLMLLFCAFTLDSYAQTVLNCDLALDLADTSETHTTLNAGDSILVYLRISNYGPDNLDTTDYVYYGMNGLPSGINLVAEDTGTSAKVYLHPNESFVTLGIKFLYPEAFSQSDTTIDYCFYLSYPPGYFVSDTTSSNDTACLSVTYKIQNTGVENIAGRDGQLFSIYPNPAKDYIDVNSIVNNTKYKIQEASVYNTMGQVIKNFRFNSATPETHRLDISDIPSGVYYISILSEADIRLNTLKLVKQ